jgi:hypothetical protein
VAAAVLHCSAADLRYHQLLCCLPMHCCYLRGLVLLLVLHCLPPGSLHSAAGVVQQHLMLLQHRCRVCRWLHLLQPLLLRLLRLEARLGY